jgi:hypothetical protein
MKEELEFDLRELQKQLLLAETAEEQFKITLKTLSVEERLARIDD